MVTVGRTDSEHGPGRKIMRYGIRSIYATIACEMVNDLPKSRASGGSLMYSALGL